MSDTGETATIHQEWLSAYLYVPDRSPGLHHAGLHRAGLHGEAGDAAALEIVATFVAHCRANGWINRYFFIRYRENGSHLRFRLAGNPDVLCAVVRPALTEFIRAASPGVVFDEVVPSPDASPWPVEHVRWVQYEPEIVRYGGPDALPIAEEFFCASSDVALALLLVIRGRPAQVRLGQGLLAMLALVHSLGLDEAAVFNFFEQYGTGYLRTLYASEPEAREALQRKFDEGVARQSSTLAEYVSEAWLRLDEGESISAPIDELVRATRKAVASLRDLPTAKRVLRNGQEAHANDEFLTRIMSSQVHMMNNRLGIRLDEEAYLAHACANVLRVSEHTLR